MKTGFEKIFAGAGAAVFVATALLVSGVFVACGETPRSEQVETQTTHYACPMHSQIIRDKPGQCPICGMDLVRLADGGENGDEGGEDYGGRETTAGGKTHAASAQGSPVVRMDTTTLRNLGVRTETVSRRVLTGQLRLDGRIVPEEGRVFSVTARVAGYAEVVHARVTGQTVRKGERLLEVYSPDVSIALERLLRASAGGEPDGTRQRLLNWDIPEGFLRRTEETGKVPARFPVESPASGVVLRKNVIEGQGIASGAELYRIADLSTVWVTARVWQSDLVWVRAGSRATVSLRNLPGRVFESVVFFVSPELDPSTRTAEIRMRLENTAALDLRPEMFAEVVLRDTAAAPVLAVPAQALLRAGGRDVAVMALGGGRFQPREVTIGREAGGWAEVLTGVKEGERIVTSAQFLIDSESNLRAALEMLRAARASGTGGAEAVDGTDEPGMPTSQGGAHVH